MKIEKLSDRQVRFHITRSDLEHRGIKLAEFAYGSDRAKALFRELLLWAEYKFNFVAHDIPIMIEAVPVNADEIILIVTKLNPQELEAYQQNNRDKSAISSDHSPRQDPGLQNPIRHLIPPRVPAEKTALFAVDRLEDLLSLAQKIPHPDRVTSSLYRDPKSQVYYLLLSSRSDNQEAFALIQAMTSEYGNLLNVPKFGEVYIAERFECILAEDALTKLQSLHTIN